MAWKRFVPVVGMVTLTVVGCVYILVAQSPDETTVQLLIGAIAGLGGYEAVRRRKT